VSMDTSEKERDFYFSKLRDIEILTEQIKTRVSHIPPETRELIEAIQRILYATEEEALSLEEFAELAEFAGIPGSSEEIGKKFSTDPNELFNY